MIMDSLFFKSLFLLKERVNDVTTTSVWKLNLFPPKRALLTCPRANLITFIAVLFKFYEVFLPFFRLEGFLSFCGWEMKAVIIFKLIKKKAKLARKVSS